jgi:hypothetical protein
MIVVQDRRGDNTPEAGVLQIDAQVACSDIELAAAHGC